ncbi:LCP family protein [Kineococcus glutinatus]|uniref:LCP family protein n=1 Tax=Kineococcus glutinatus TaxID=1070872 RepID=UPI0031E8CBB3
MPRSQPSRTEGTSADAAARDLPGTGRLPRGRHASHQHGVAYRLLRAAGVGVLGLSVVAAGGGAYAWYRLQGNINAESITDRLGIRPDTEATVDPTTGQSALNVLVMGSDTRELADGTGDEYGGLEAAEGARSDTTVLVHLAADRRSATLVSIPRDSMVQIPDCTADDGTVVAAHRGQFNSAFSEGGTACTVKTVESVTDVLIDHYAVVDFSGFRSMIDALGGVTICTPEDIEDRKANLYLPAGTHEDVDGETALAYARVRYIGDGSDISRIGRQQALMSSMVQKVLSSDVLLRPDRLFSFLDAATKSVTTDPELASLNQMRQLAQSLQKMPADGVRFVTVPNEPDPRNDARVVWTAAADELWRQIRTDTTPGATPSPSPTASTDPSTSSALTIPPQRISVQVLNVGGETGAAGRAAQALGALGFTVTGTGDGEATASTEGVHVRYGPDRADSAATVTASFPGATSAVDPALGRGIVVEVGTGAPAPVDVSARLVTPSTPTSTGGATPEPTITARVATDDICA